MFIDLVEQAYSECDGNWRSCEMPETIEDVKAHIASQCDGVLRFNTCLSTRHPEIKAADGGDGDVPEHDYTPVWADWTDKQLAKVLAAAQAVARAYETEDEDYCPGYDDVSDDEDEQPQHFPPHGVF